MNVTIYLICAAVLALCLAMFGLYSVIRKHTDMLGSVAHNLATAEIALEILQKDMADMKVQLDNHDADSEKAMVEALERKWEEATQAIQNFDPYKLGES